MATWNTPIPGTAVEGADTHVDDHNKINAALAETRTQVDGKQDAGSYASATDLAALAARVQALEDAAQPEA